MSIVCSCLNDIRNAIHSDEIKAVSFDVFGTLLLRPVKRETDVYFLLGKTYRELTGSRSDFRTLRIEADAILRRRIISGEITKEDITLAEIYEVMSGEMGVSREAADKLVKAECDLEVKLACPRKSGRMLLKEALASGKKTFLTSDMYLPSDTIRRMLSKCGIDTSADLFVSSELGLRKITGNLYRYVAEQTGYDPGSILHIGDNPGSDIDIPEKLGFRTVYFPSTESLYEQNGFLIPARKFCSASTDLEASRSTVLSGINEQMTANHYFDDPFRPFIPDSAYNCDPYLVGYGALGSEVCALVRWLASKAKDDGLKKIMFLSRDGYLPMLAYDMLREIDTGLPPSDYLPVSRLSVLPAMFSGPSDLITLPVDPSYHTYESILKLLGFCCRDGLTVSDIMPGADSASKLTRGTLTEFISAFIRNGYDRSKHEEAVGIIRDYMLAKGIGDDTGLFDMGYSGRNIAAIAYATGKHPKAYYFHKDPSQCLMYEQLSGIRIDAFIDMSLQMESTIREYSYLEAAPSCIGYTKDKTALFDCGPAEGYSKTAVMMQKGALDHVSDFLFTFGDLLDIVKGRNTEASIPFESFIRFTPDPDLKMYEDILIDDELWGGRRDIDLRKLIEARLSKLPGYVRRD